MPGHRTSGRGFGLWPTPVASDATAGAVFGKDDVFYETKSGMPRKLNRHGTDGSVGLARLAWMWPTPRVSGVERYATRLERQGHSKAMSYLEAHVDFLEMQKAAMFPTPTASEHKCRLRGNTQQSKSLGALAKKGLLPTPNARDWKDSGATQGNRKSPNLGTVAHQMTPGTVVGGSLNPTWVEWLMGWPLGWTDCAALATDRFRQWQRSHGRCFRKGDPDDSRTGFPDTLENPDADFRDGER